MKKTIFFGFLLALALPVCAQAYAVKTDKAVFIGREEVVEGNLYAAGSTINIDGVVTGDVYCAGQTINISGEISGDVICLGQNINLTGKIGGSFRAAGNAINTTAKIARNIVAVGATIAIGLESEIGWDALLAGANIDLRGKIGRNLLAAASVAHLGGEISGNVNLKINNGNQKNREGKTGLPAFIISETAKINGDLSYTAEQTADIQTGSQIAGKTTKKTPVYKIKNDRNVYLAWFWTKVFSIFSALVIGLVLISLWREEIKKLSDNMLENITHSLSIGVAVFFLAPIVAFFLMLTFIGLPLALIVIAVWAIGLYVAKIITAILIGRSLLFRGKDESLVWSMIIGIIACWIVFSLPVIGWLLGFAAILWGLGGLWLALRKA